MKSLNDIRSSFLEFFRKNGHESIPSAPLVPRSDPTLMFTSAGMVPFKNVFTGAEKLKTPKGQDIKRAASSQKCVRAGGKHNDLDNVGYTARHHTFFEMLGNFSFGDYFKEGAINLAWDLLTKTFALPKDKLLVTVYHTDDEAFNIWKKVSGFPDSKIIRIPTNDNFWAMGDTGPCGPCSEIFYDHGDKIAGGPPGSPDADGDRFVEIWNLVFMQYDQITTDKRENLPKPCIDTGMGLERITAVMQGVHDNYDIDLFRNLIEASKITSGNNREEFKASHRVIADHLRSSCFLIADGVLPSNEGRGYVLRRIMRRAMRHAHILGCKEPLMYRLVPALIKEMGSAYHELGRAEDTITETLKYEEEKFMETLERGLKLLESEAGNLKKGQKLKGATAFKLYDTYGFPLDLTEDVLRSRGIGIDAEGFSASMEEQKKRARAAWAGSGESKTDEVWFTIKDKHGATEFLGYETTEASGKIIAIVKDGKIIDSAKAGEIVSIITNQTPFYGESGGQTGDYGKMSLGETAIDVTDTKKYLGALHVHISKITKGEIKIGDIVTMLVNGGRRDALRANHSATHLLHAVLRKLIGKHITQKGSLVESNYFRFDFSHPKALSSNEIEKIEDEVNRLVRQNTDVCTRVMTPDEAIEKGAMALFGEKYGDEVRVVNMGQHDEGDYSVELCGGTHVRRTGDIGLFKILKESAVAAGVRRIEGVTGVGALEYVRRQQQLLNETAGSLKSSPDEIVNRVEALFDEKKKLEKEISDLRKKVAMGISSGSNEKSESSVEEINGIKFIGKVLDGVPAKDLRGLVDDFKKQVGSGVVAIVATNDGKAAVVIGVTNDLTSKVSAVDLVKIGSETLGGKGGGGRPDFAQAGGPDVAKAAEAIAQIKKALK